MIHVPVSLRQCRLSSISNDTPLEIIAGQGVVHSLRSGFITYSECGKSFRILSPVFFKLLNDMGKEGEMF